jgi:threonylcarbamoyladenosine tRNA methylthiotransferase MtaB
MSKDKITFSWDIICGFPGETDELFNETLMLVQETRPIKIHAFPYSPRPDTPAAYMQNQIDKSISKKRVKIISYMTNQNRIQFMNTQIGNTVQVLVEENNIARTPNDIPVKICGSCIPVRTICDVTLTDIADDIFVGKIL